MLKFTSTPTNPNILKEDLGMIKKYTAIIFLCVCYQVITEFSFFYSIFQTNLSHFYGGRFLSFIFSTAFTLIIEGLGISCLMYVIVSTLEKRNGFTIRFILPLVTVGICYISSFLISYHGVPNLVNKLTVPPTLATTIKIDSILTMEKKEINKTYSSDSILIKNRYSNQILSLKQEYKSLIDFQKAEKKKYKRQKLNGSKWAQSWINKTTSNILKLRSKEAKEKRDLVIAESKELSQLQEKRKKDITSFKDSHKLEKETIENNNTTLSNQYKSKISNRNDLYRYVVLFTLLLIIFGTIYILNSKHKAGIKTHSQVNQYFFEESIFNKVIHLLKLKFNIWVHGKIDKQINALTPPTPSDDPLLNKIYEKRDFTEYVNPYELDETQKNLKSFASIPIAVNKVGELNTDTVRNGNGLNKSRTGTDQRTAANKGTGTVVKEKVLTKVQHQKELKECEKKGCTNTFTPYPKHKRFCSDKCRIRNFKDVNGYAPYMKKRKTN